MSIQAAISHPSPGRQAVKLTPRLEYRILGPLELRVDGRVVSVGGPMQRSLLGVLLVYAGEVVSVQRLIDVLWGERPPKTARTSLHGLVSRLRAALDAAGEGFSPLVSRAPGYVLEVGLAELDRNEFERFVAESAEAKRAGDLAGAATRLRQALRLWRGPALGGADADELVALEAPRLEERRLVVLEDRIELDLALGRDAELVGELAALVAAHPLRERLRGQHMLALHRSGRQAEALESYREARTMLVDDLGLEPGSALRELERAILTEDPMLPPPPAGAPTPPARPATPGQLPPTVADFTGRAEAVERLLALLGREPDARAGGVAIAAISGKAGVGKTALALRTAHELRARFPDGQLYVSLRGAERAALDPAEVLAEWLGALGLPSGAVPDGMQTRSCAYRGLLADRKMLVVLDDALNEAQIRPLLPAGSSCAVLITSRHCLVGLEAAQFVELDVLEPAQAVHLLGAVAGPERIAAEPRAARAIVAHCGYLPLAVRIAGARLASRGHWSLEQLAERLADERRRLDELTAGDLEVRASVGLSYRALDEDDRRAVRLLGALEGPDFAPWLAGALLDLPLAGAQDLLERLRDRQLLDVAGDDALGQVRYRFHDLLWAYARECLAAEEPAASRAAALARAQDACVILARRAAARLSSLVPLATEATGAHRPSVDRDVVRQVDADPLVWLECERAVLIAVAELASRTGQSSAWRLTASLARFFEARGNLDGWQRTHDVALDASRRRGDTLGEAMTLRGLGFMHLFRGTYDDGIACLTAAVTEFDRTGERYQAAGARLALGVCHTKGCVEATIASFERCLAAPAGLEDAYDVISAQILVEAHRKGLEAAGACLHEALDAYGAAGDRFGEGASLQILAAVLRNLGRLDDAVDCAERALAAYEEVGNQRAVGYALLALGTARRDQHDLPEAHEIVERALGRFCELGDRRGEAYARAGLGITLRALGRPDDADGQLQRARAGCQAIGEGATAALVLHALADVRLDQGDTAQAQAHLRAAVKLCAAHRLPLLQARAHGQLAHAFAAAGALESARAQCARVGELAGRLAAPIESSSASPGPGALPLVR